MARLWRSLRVFFVGVYVIYGCGQARYGVFSALFPLATTPSTTQTSALMRSIISVGVKATKVLYVGITWFLGFPILVGSWLMLILAPLRITLYQTPAFCPYYSYAIGLLYFKIWYRLSMVEGFDPKWKAKFDKVHQDGITNMDISFITKELFFPVANAILLRLCVPYIFTRAVLPLLQTYFEFSEEYQSILVLFSYSLFTLFLASVAIGRSSISFLVQIHQQIRDEKYLIGQKLLNSNRVGRVDNNNINNGNNKNHNDVQMQDEDNKGVGVDEEDYGDDDDEDEEFDEINHVNTVQTM